MSKPISFYAFIDKISTTRNENINSPYITTFNGKKIVYGTKQYFEVHRITDGIITFWDKNELIVSPLFSKKLQICSKCFLNQRNTYQNVQEKEFITSFNNFKFNDNWFTHAITSIIKEPLDTFNLFHYYILNNFELKLTHFYRVSLCSKCRETKDSEVYVLNYFNEMKRNQMPVKTNVLRSKRKKIRHVLANENKDSNFFIFKDLLDANTISTEIYFKHNDEEEFISGIGTSSELIDSEEMAIFEALERFTGTKPVSSKSIYMSMTELSDKGIDYFDPNHYLSNAGVSKKIDNESKIYWTKSYSSLTQSIYLIPEDFIYYKTLRSKDSKKIVNASSNGHALGNSMSEAIVFSIFELLERDAFLVHWYANKKPMEIDKITICDEEIISDLDKIEGLGYEVHIFKITLEIDIPIYWVYSEGIGKDRFATYSTSSAHYDSVTALKSAVGETLLALSYYGKGMDSIIEKSKNMTRDEIINVADHPIYYAIQERKKNFSFLNHTYRIEFENSRPITEIDLNQYCLSLINKVQKNYGEIFIARTTSKGIEEQGLESVKVFIPGIQEMYFGDVNQIVNRKRISKYKKINGVKDFPIHPFP
ncbi:YcaO-like family protein [Bacillus cereus]|uniref:SagD family bacteriocin biosynthesis docking scaffold n=1 Tax=Bacillus cereus HuA4-10 TaxID=1053206 RepID=J7ZU16_BACCE|nr:YcaO-like family protein [Bacillus cereus]EJQ72888.1 SagD family bacteriocin biosynthesis docking scaffold [Bacillus cereus HuA4-10]